MKLWKIFDEAGAVFVIDFYADAFSGRLTRKDPYCPWRQVLVQPSLQRGISDKRDLIERVAASTIWMAPSSCPIDPVGILSGQLDLASFVRNELGLPVLFFEGIIWIRVTIQENR